MTLSEFYNSIDYNFFCLMHNIESKILDEIDIERIKALPNFDPDIFKEITGIEIK